MAIRMNLTKTSASIAALAVGCGASGAALANDDVIAMQDDPANVVMPSISYNGWNYSGLDQINLENVADLGIAWTMQIGVLDWPFWAVSTSA